MCSPQSSEVRKKKWRFFRFTKRKQISLALHPQETCSSDGGNFRRCSHEPVKPNRTLVGLKVFPFLCHVNKVICRRVCSFESKSPSQGHRWRVLLEGSASLSQHGSQIRVHNPKRSTYLLFDSS